MARADAGREAVRRTVSNPVPATSSSLDFQGIIGSLFSAMAQPVPYRPGGFPEDLFLDISPEERHKYECCICFMIVREAKQCNNAHLFCANCIFTWTMTSGDGRHTCPVCREDGKYRSNLHLDRSLSKKRVRCGHSPGCEWTGPLREHRKHLKTVHHHVGSREDLLGERDAGDLTATGAISTRTQDSSPIVASSGRLPRDPGTTFGSRESFAQLNTRITRGRQRLDFLFDMFGDHLHRRRAEIQEMYEERERRRRQQLLEVRDLGRRLGEVAGNLMHLLNNISDDGDRYKTYITQGTLLDREQAVSGSATNTSSEEQTEQTEEQSSDSVNTVPSLEEDIQRCVAQPPTLSILLARRRHMDRLRETFDDYDDDDSDAYSTNTI